MRVYGKVDEGKRRRAAEALEKFINWRRTIRAYLPDPIPKEILMKIVNSGRWAPTKNNQVKWQAFLVTSPEAREGLVDALKKSYSYLEDVRVLHETGYLDLEQYRGFVSKFLESLERVPAFVVMVAERPPRELPQSLWARELAHTLASCGFAAENMLLTALAWGVGGGILTLVSDEAEEEVLGFLGLSPERHTVALILTFGYPAEVPKKPSREVRIVEL